MLLTHDFGNVRVVFIWGLLLLLAEVTILRLCRTGQYDGDL